MSNNFLDDYIITNMASAALLFVTKNVDHDQYPCFFEVWGVSVFDRPKLSWKIKNFPPKVTHKLICFLGTSIFLNHLKFCNQSQIFNKLGKICCHCLIWVNISSCSLDMTILLKTSIKPKFHFINNIKDGFQISSSLFNIFY